MVENILCIVDFDIFLIVTARYLPPGEVIVTYIIYSYTSRGYIYSHLGQFELQKLKTP